MVLPNNDGMLISLNDFERKAKEILPKTAYEYYTSGACDEITHHRNQQAYRDLCLIPRVLIDVSTRKLTTTLFGCSISSPILIAPTAFHGMATPTAELATAQAAKAMQTIMVASTMANTTLEEIAKASSENLWFQLYLLNDREATVDLIKRAELADYKALVITVDAQVLGIREADLRNQFKLPNHLTLKNLEKYFDNSNEKTKAGSQELFNKCLTWHDIEWLRSITKLPILLKGILHSKDAKLAVEMGVAGIIVSNHGGRHLDTTLTTVEALPAIVEAVAGKIPVLIDGGIRRGTDIAKALALGADAVLIGRPILWGLAVNGWQGALQILTILKNEFDTAMALCGISSIEELRKNGRGLLYRKR